MKRREFLKSTSTLGFAGSVTAGTALQLGYVRQASAMAFNDYKALVCILLAGGNDSYNMIVPTDQDQYDQYAAIRSDLAHPLNELLPLAGQHNGRNYGVHPGMPGVQSMFAAGELAVVANVGPLVDYVTAADVEGGAPVPLGVFSHSDQIQTWQTAVPYQRVAQGWGGRLGDIMQDANPANGISMNISLSGSNVFQSGNVVTPYAIDTSDDGVPGIASYDDEDPFGATRRRMIDDMLALPQSNLLRREYVRRLSGSIDARETFVAGLSQSTPFTTEFSPGLFSQALRQIARVIAARDPLGQRVSERCSARFYLTG